MEMNGLVSSTQPTLKQISPKNKLQIVNWLLTRKCNLNCSYCGLVKNPLTKKYSGIKHYHANEMSPLYIKSCLIEAYRINPHCFHIFYGGEPFLYPYLDEVILFCNQNNIYYTIITNNTDKIKPLIKKVLNKVERFFGLSASIDPIIYTDNTELKLSDRYKKSIAGLQNLKALKPFVDDLVAEITIDASNIKSVYKLVEHLSENGIWASITFIDVQKNKYYDFSNISQSKVELQNIIISQTDEVYDLLQSMINAGFLIHMGEDLLDRIYNILPYNLDCKLEEYNHNLTIDADGTLRLCLRIKGVESQKYKALDYFLNFETCHSAMIKDKKNYCNGCCWTCPIMSRLAVEEDMVTDILHNS